MKRCSLVLLVLFVLARTHTPLLAALQSKADPKGNDTIDGWARDNYHRALDLLLPDRCASAIDARWLACVRIVPPFRNEIEYLLSVQRQLDGSIFAQITRPKAHSIYVQLRQRRKEHAQVPLAELAKLIEIETQAGDQRRFPQLADLANEFEGLRLSPVLSDEIMMDPTQYRFRVRSFAGERMELTLDGPGSGAPVQPPGLIRWAESVRKTLASAFN